MGTGFVGGAIGNTVVGYFVKKYKKTWFVGACVGPLFPLFPLLYSPPLHVFLWHFSVEFFLPLWKHLCHFSSPPASTHGQEADEAGRACAACGKYEKHGLTKIAP